MNIKQKKNYKPFVIIVTVNTIGALGNLSCLIFIHDSWSWINAVSGFFCTLILVFVLTHRNYYIREG